MLILIKLLILCNIVFYCSAAIFMDPEKNYHSEIEVLIATMMKTKIESMQANLDIMQAKMDNMQGNLDNTEAEKRNTVVQMENMEMEIARMGANILNMDAKIENLENTVAKQTELLKNQQTCFDTQRNMLKKSGENHTSESGLLNGKSQEIETSPVFIQQIQKQQQLYEEKLNEIESTVMKNGNLCRCSMEQGNDKTGHIGSTNGKILHQDRQSGSNTRKERQLPETVAFSAYLDRELVNLGPNHIIPFNGVVLNDGNAYNHFTGVFAAPIPGVYTFSFFTEDWRAHRLWVKLVVDGQLISSAVTSVNSQGYNSQAGNVVIIRLTAGQSVWVAIDPHDAGDSLQGGNDLRATTFSGVFLYS